MASKRGKGSKRRRTDGKSSSDRARPASRAGSHAGRGFRYQDAVSVWLAVEVWARRRPSATVVPEGGDDVEMRGAFTSFVQVKSRREHLGGYTVGEAARHIEELWSRGIGSSQQSDRSELILERGVAGLTSASDGLPNVAGKGPLVRELKRIGGWEKLLSRTTISVATDPQEVSIKAISNARAARRWRRRCVSPSC